MICAGFLSPVDRADLTALARDGSAAHRLARRANALVLLDRPPSSPSGFSGAWRVGYARWAMYEATVLQEKAQMFDSAPKMRLSQSPSSTLRKWQRTIGRWLLSI